MAQVPISYLVTCERVKFARFAAVKTDVDIVFEEEWISGFQLYIVQQWVTDRNKFLKSVVAFTGNQNQMVLVSVVKFENGSLERDFPDLLSEYKRPMSTQLGEILVTNLSRIPALLNLVAVPDGDFERAIGHIHLSINLRRLGCSGRSAVALRFPSEAKDKFCSLYKVSSNVPLEFAVIELVRLAQLSLVCFDLLPIDVCDGLFCDETLEALKSYITLYNLQTSEEHDDILQYSKVFAHLFSSFQITRSLLHTMGVMTPKDPFVDVIQFRKIIASFQESRDLLAPGTISSFLSSFQDGALKTKLPKTDENAGKPTTDLEQCIRMTSFDRLKYLWTGTGKSFADEVNDLSITDGLREGGAKLGQSIKRATDMLIKPIEDSFTTTVDGLVGLSKEAYKGMKNTPANIASSFKVKRSTKTPDVPNFPASFNNNSPISVGSNDPIDDIQEDDDMPAVVSRMPHLKPLSKQSSSDYDEVLEALQTQEQIFTGRKEELQKMMNECDTQIRVMTPLVESREQDYKIIEARLAIVLKRNDVLLKEIESIDNQSSILHYHVSVVENKIAETQELIENYSALIATLDTQIHSSFDFRLGQFAQLVFEQGWQGLKYFSGQVLIWINQLRENANNKSKQFSASTATSQQ